MTSELHTKIALITGGTKGIGRATAEQLAQRSIHVVLVGRSNEAGTAVAAGIQASGGSAEFIAADLSLMRDVRRIAAAFLQRHSRLDMLVHSADVLRMQRLNNSEGLEVSFATNYLSRFLLNSLLLDLLQASSPARIVHVAAAGFPGKLDLAQVPPGPTLSSFNGHNIGQRANDVYAVELAARLISTGVTVNVLNPGMVDTDIRRNAPDGKLLIGIMEWLSAPWKVRPEDFARLVVRVATAPEFAQLNGALLNNKGKLIAISPATQDTTTRAGLWRQSEELVTRREATQAVYAAA